MFSRLTHKKRASNTQFLERELPTSDYCLKHELPILRKLRKIIPTKSSKHFYLQGPNHVKVNYIKKLQKILQILSTIDFTLVNHASQLDPKIEKN